MCAVATVPFSDSAKPEREAECRPPINFPVLRDLARLDGHHETHGSLVGTSAVTALLLQDLVDQVRCIGAHFAEIKCDAPTGNLTGAQAPQLGSPPAGGATTAKAGAAAPAPVAQPGGSGFRVIASLGSDTVGAIAAGVGGVL